MHDTTNDMRIGRRPVLKGAAASLAALGGLSGTAAASHGGPTSLTDRGADILVYWSEVDEDDDDPDRPSDFGFPAGPATPTGGPVLGLHDGAGGLFDFGNLVMYPDHDIVNHAWFILGGAVMSNPPGPEYRLEHLGKGFYRAKDQMMTFTANPAAVMKGAIRDHPVFDRLGGKEWFVVGREYAKLATQGGTPDPSKPEWGVTRLDFFDVEEEEFGLSLLYVISADDEADANLLDQVGPLQMKLVNKLIRHGRIEADDDDWEEDDDEDEDDRGRGRDDDDEDEDDRGRGRDDDDEDEDDRGRGRDDDDEDDDDRGRGRDDDDRGRGRDDD